MLKNIFTDCNGNQFERTENESGIEWRVLGGRIEYTYHRFENRWYEHITPMPYSQVPYLEAEFQRQKRKYEIQPKFNLVSFGHSFSGEEVIELHILNESNGRWEKVPAKVTLEDGITVEELKNQTKKRREEKEKRSFQLLSDLLNNDPYYNPK